MHGQVEKPIGGWKLGKHSFTKLWVAFTDGSKRTRYSKDWKHVFSTRRDRQLGLDRLRKLVAKWGAGAEMVIIYENYTNGPEVERYQYGIRTKTKINK